MIAILSLSSIAFSQTGTNNEPVKCFPIPVVKQITKDLISGDSAKAQLKLTELQLAETEKIIEKKVIEGNKIKVSYKKTEEGEFERDLSADRIYNLNNTLFKNNYYYKQIKFNYIKMIIKLTNYFIKYK